MYGFGIGFLLARFAKCADCEEWTLPAVDRQEKDKHLCADCLANYVRCADCDDLNQDTVTVASGERVCESCADYNYFYCEDCEEYRPQDESNSVGDRYVGDRYVCDRCLSHNYYQCDDCRTYVRCENANGIGDYSVCDSCYEDYNYCEHCEEYYRDGYGAEHEHGCDCDAPNPSFTFPNDGDGTIFSDSIATVTLPAGIISEEGLNEIRHYLAREHSVYIPNDAWDALGDSYTTNRGNFPKRLSRTLHLAGLPKLSPETLSTVGTLARTHSSADSTYRVSLSRADLNDSASAWFHSGSCWWGSYSQSRCTLKQSGGIGLRTWDENGNVTGRAWILPIGDSHEDGTVSPYNDLANPATARALVVFNGYGALSGYVGARIVAHMLSRTYRKVVFSSWMGNEHLYVNTDREGYERGYVIGDYDPTVSAIRVRTNTC